MKICSNSKEVVELFENIKSVSISLNPDDGCLNAFLCPINARKFDYAALSDVLVDSVIDYALDQKTIEKYSDKAGTLSKKARIKYKEYKTNKGELGELILFCFLEGHLNAPKILTKMSLKTSGSMYVNGSDGVHLLDNGNGKYKLIFCESKLHKSLSRALNDAFNSIYNFVNETNDKGNYKTGIKYEKDLISSTIDNYEFSEEDKRILDLIIYPRKNKDTLQLDDAFSIFIGYEIDISEETKNCTDDNFSKKVKEKVLTELTKMESKIYDKINQKNMVGHTFYVYIIPFTDIDITRIKILEEILKWIACLKN